MGSSGLRLRGARESRGLRLVDVAKATKVAAHHLVALEYGDFEVLPELDVLDGYVRTYAEYLGLDPDDAAAELAREIEACRPAPQTEAEPAGEVEADVPPPAPEPEVEVAVDPVPPSPGPAAEVTEATERLAPIEARGWRIGRWAPVVWAGLALLLILAGWWWVGAGDTPEEPRAPADSSAEPSAPRVEEPAAVVDTPVEEAAAAEAVTAEEVPPPAVEPVVPSAGLTVVEHGVGTDVVDHRLVGEADRFVEGTQVWFWTHVRGGTTGNTIRHVWSHEGRVIMSFPLKIGAYHWRTQSRKTLSPGSAGAWVVEVLDETGQTLARREFACVTRSSRQRAS